MLSLDQAVLDPASRVAERLRQYAEKLESLDVIVPAAGPRENFFLNPKIKVYPLRLPFKAGYFWKSFILAKRIIKQKPVDLITTQDPWATALVGYLLKKKCRIALNIQLHGDWFGSRYWRRQSLAHQLLYFLGRLIVKKADSLRAVSGKIKDSLVNLGVTDGKISVLPLFEDYQKLTRQTSEIDLHKLYPGKKIILFVGRLAPEKNLPALLEAFKIIQQQLPETLSVIVGQGPEENNLKNSVKKLNLTNRVIFYPWQRELAGFYKTADVFVLPSLTEGYNRTVVEAMSCGLPVVMTNVGPACDLVINGFNGLIVEGDLIKAMPPLIIKVLTDEDLRKKLIANGLAAIKQLPALNEYLQAVIDNWQMALANNKKF